MVRVLSVQEQKYLAVIAVLSDGRSVTELSRVLCRCHVGFWLAVAGIGTAAYLYLFNTHLPKNIAMAFGPLYALVERKYGFDELYSWLFAGGARSLGRGFWRGGDQAVIDGLMVNGSARVVGWFSGVIRLVQSGLVNQYAVAMLIGICTLLPN